MFMIGQAGFGEPAIIFCCGILAGIVSAVFGVGGGFLFTPLFHAGFHYTPVSAVATSTAQIPFTTLSGLLRYFSKVKINYRLAAAMLLGALPGSQAAVVIYDYARKSSFGSQKILNNNTGLDLFLIACFVLLLIVMAYLSFRQNKPTAPEDPHAEVTISAENPTRLFIKTVLWGILVGLFSGFLGVGGGLLSVPYLIHVCKFTTVKAAATSLLIIFPVALFSALHYGYLGYVNAGAALFAALGGMIGAQIGVKISLGSEEKRLKRALGFFQLSIAIAYIGGKLLPF